MINKSPFINLLKTGKVSFLEKFIEWALTFGRVVVIFTEVIALGAFLYRFSLDRQLIDLHDQITIKDTYVKALKNNEDTYRDLQERLTSSSTLGKNAIQIIKTYKNIAVLAPADFTINSFKISEENMQIDANVQSVSSLNNFITSLKKYPSIKSVSLDTIENKTSRATIAVSITASFKKKL